MLSLAAHPASQYEGVSVSINNMQVLPRLYYFHQVLELESLSVSEFFDANHYSETIGMLYSSILIDFLYTS